MNGMSFVQHPRNNQAPSSLCAQPAAKLQSTPFRMSAASRHNGAMNLKPRMQCPPRLEILATYPDLREEDFQQTLAFAATVDGTIDFHLDAA